jgi:peptide/nickel transport system permease protein
LLVRVVEASEAFFVPGLLACAVAMLLGVPLGAWSGWAPQARSAALCRGALTLIGAWPRLVLVVLVVAIFTSAARDPAAWAGVRLYLLAAVVGLSWTPQVAGAVAEKVHWLLREQFVEAARAHGLSPARILFRHILWANCRNAMLRQACMLFGSFLLVETSLSYLGHYGVPAPRPSWGNILSDVKFAVIQTRTLLIPDSPTPGDVLAAAGRAVQEGGALAVLVPGGLIALSIGGLLALAEHFARRDAA